MHTPKTLNEATKRFWASGVSFRNLVTGNKDHLIGLLRRNVQFRLVELDPESPLSQPEMIRKFSRTATRESITQTIEALVGNNGILRVNGNPSRHELWVSDYAPIVPMVIVDDSVYVSFLRHVDREGTQSAYGTTYLKVRADSGTGRALLEHFSNMLDHARRLSFSP